MVSLPVISCPVAADSDQSGASGRWAVSASSPGNPFRDEPEGPPSGKPPVIPHAAPIVDREGRLTYVGSDGLRYVVAEPPPQDPAR